MYLKAASSMAGYVRGPDSVLVAAETQGTLGCKTEGHD